MMDLIIDRSPEQKRIRMEKMRAELTAMGFSIVETEWLKAILLSNISRESRRVTRRKSNVQHLEQVAG